MTDHNLLPGRLGLVSMDGELPWREDLGLVFDELDHQLACQLYLWALPLVSYAQWQLQHRDVFGATNYDLVHYVSYRDRLGLITANATTPYILNFIDLAETGPLIVELPAGPSAGGLSDFWQREFAILGEMGPDQGAGGKHLIVPPGAATPEVDDSYYVHQATGMNVMFGFRTLDPDPVRSHALVHGVRITPYDDRDAPETRIVSPAGRAWDGDQPRGLEYWVRLHEIYQREVVDERDRLFLGMLNQLGIAKGKPFEPDERLSKILMVATAAGELMAQANSFAKRFPGATYWPDRQWDLVVQLDHSDQRTGNYDQLLERTAWFYEAVSFSEAMKSQTPGNWVQTIPGRHWFSYFRFYGPLEPYFDRSWKLGDIIRA